MTEADLKTLAEILNKKSETKISPLTSILIGLTIAVAGNLIGWVANKSTGDIANSVKIMQSLDYLQTDVSEIKSNFSKEMETVNKKLENSFTRAEFEREMSFRDNDYTRLKNQFEEFDKKRR